MSKREYSTHQTTKILLQTRRYGFYVVKDVDKDVQIVDPKTLFIKTNKGEVYCITDSIIKNNHLIITKKPKEYEERYTTFKQDFPLDRFIIDNYIKLSWFIMILLIITIVYVFQ